jgi:hypothetical protein
MPLKSRQQGASVNGEGDGTTPIQRSHDNDDAADFYIQQSIEKDHHQQQHITVPKHTNTTPGPHIIYIVVDTCYPTSHAFETNIGTANITSVHSTKVAANSRAKKIIYENDSGCTVDLDKIIEEVRRGLYTGIGVGGKEEKEGCCFARKCEVEDRVLDEDSDGEEGSERMHGKGKSGGDVEMG